MAAKKHQSIFHILLIATAAVMVWRGTWGLMDIYLFPDNPLVSYIISLVLGLIILFATKHLDEDIL